MRVKLRRRVFTLLSVLSLVLCLATVFLWVRDHNDDETLSWVNRAGNKACWVEFSDGSLLTCLDRYSTSVFGTSGGWRHEKSNGPRDFRLFFIVAKEYFRVGRFAVGGDRTETNNRQLAVVPLWMLVFVFAVLPVCRIGHYLYGRKRDASICSNCGYDLRATPERCPECGAVPSAKIKV